MGFPLVCQRETYRRTCTRTFSSKVHQKEAEARGCFKDRDGKSRQQDQVIIYTSRPGVVIGKRLERDQLLADIQSQTKNEVYVNIQGFESPTWMLSLWPKISP